MNSRARLNQSGQGTTEYILLLLVIVTAFITVSKWLVTLQLAEKLASPIRDRFARTYRYGYFQAKGFTDGGPEKHPRALDPGTGKTRIFISPKIN